MKKRSNTERSNFNASPERKLFGQILYDDLSAQITIPFELDAEGMDKLIQKV